MKDSIVLTIDALINFVLGILLMLVIPFPDLPRILGVPQVGQAFYPSIMGAVFIGVGIALVIEVYRKGQAGLVGLGLGGAVAINLCGGMTLMGWLLFGGLGLPLKGSFFLWVIALLLVGISTIELIVHFRQRGKTP
jgi:hypothetical protein